MTKALALLLLFSISLVSCAQRINISKDARFKNLVGCTISSRVPLKLYEIDYQIDGYRDRYSLGGEVGGQPLVGIVPAAHPVFFEKAIRRIGVGGSSEYLEGVIKFEKRAYPFAYHLGLSGGKTSDYMKGLHYDFVFPYAPTGATTEQPRLSN